MTRRRSVLLGAAGVLLVAFAALGVAAWRWLPSDAELAQRLASRFAERTGVELDIARTHWSVWPVPTLVVEEARTRQERPITVAQLRLESTWRALLHRQWQVDEVEIDGAHVPQDSLRALGAAARDRGARDDPAPAGPAALTALAGARVRFSDVAWIGRRDIALEYEGELHVDDDGLPQRFVIGRVGVQPTARLDLLREGRERKWRAEVEVAGGRWDGALALSGGEAGKPLRLDGQFKPQDVDVELLAATFKRHSVVAGRANGETTLRVEGDRPGGLLGKMSTRTRFAIQPARIKGFDLARAVSSAGQDRSGSTALDSLTGIVETQNTQQGVLFRYSELKARSGVLTASGNLRLLQRRLDGELAVDLVDGVVGVPLQISGTVESPSVSLTGGALTGAAVGTAVLPGVGTALGARIGREIERLLGDEEPKKGGKRSAPAAASPSRSPEGPDRPEQSPKAAPAPSR